MSGFMESETSPADPTTSKPTVVAVGNSHIWSLVSAGLKPGASELPYVLKGLPFFGPKYQPYWLVSVRRLHESYESVIGR